MTDENKTSPTKGEKKKEENGGDSSQEAATVEVIEILSPSPGISVSLLIFWVLPIMLLAFCSHLAFDKDKSFQLNIPEDRKVSIDLTGGALDDRRKKKKRSPSSSPSSTPGKKKMSRPSPRPSPLPSAHSSWPTSYRATIDTIQKRDRKVPRIGTTSSSSSSSNSNNQAKDASSPNSKKDAAKSSKKKSSSSSSTASPGRDPARAQYEDRIDEYRDDYEADPDNVLKAIRLADALRLYDVTYHDGGTKQQESIATYDRAIEKTVIKRKQMVEAGEDTTKALPGSSASNVREEVMLDYSQKSVDGLLCAMYTALGKVYFMANMFERAVESYSECLELEPLYLDALGSVFVVSFYVCLIYFCGVFCITRLRKFLFFFFSQWPF